MAGIIFEEINLEIKEQELFFDEIYSVIQHLKINIEYFINCVDQSCCGAE